MAGRSRFSSVLTVVHVLSKGASLSTKEGFSGVFGAVSLTCSLVQFLPQLLENYRTKSAAGVSLTFLLIWLVGDLANLVGAFWAGLIPTIIVIAAYYVLSDVALISQCMYYNWLNQRRGEDPVPRNQEVPSEPTEEEPLLYRQQSHHSIDSQQGDRRDSNMGLPGSHVGRRRSSAASRNAANGDGAAAGPVAGGLAKILEDEEGRGRRSATKEWIFNTVAIILICGVGTAAWAICWKTGIWKPSVPPEDKAPGGIDGGKGEDIPVGAEILGYISAILYLGARIPQIIKNYKDKSCEGLSLLFFLLSLMGNLTYGAGILAHSLQREYLITNTPWLIGSLGTMAEDITIFVQFRIYGDYPHADSDALSDSEAVE